MKLRDYSRSSIVQALRSVGVEDGSVVFCHASIGRLGRPEGEVTMPAVSQMILSALRDAVGIRGTLLMPSYTYSIGRGERFDVDATPGTVGPLAEHFRSMAGTRRSADPMLAVCGAGPLAGDLFEGLPWTCYGEGSLYERLRKVGATICTLGLPLHWATFRHHVEEAAAVPFRFAKLFTGEVSAGGKTVRETWSYFAAVRQDCCAPDGRRLQQILRDGGDCQVVPLGRSELWCIDAERYFQRAVREFERDPWLSAKGPAASVADLVGMEDRRVGGESVRVSLPVPATPFQVVRELTPLPRDVVSAGFDAALTALGAQVSLQVHDYPSGTKCFGWTVPEKWTCHEAWLETLDGRRLLDRRDSPLHVLSYSQPFEGEVSRDELLAHFYSHPEIPAAVPFVYSYFTRRWGLCGPQSLRESLTEDRYRLCIRAETSFGYLRVGESVVPGESKAGFVLCAHLDHPGQANDGLSGAAVGVEVIRRLRSLPRLRHTVRLLVLSETFGSLAWLSHHEDALPDLKAGLFLEMLGLPFPFAYQRSWAGNTAWDAAAIETLRARDRNAWNDDFLRIITNDERQFNAPGIRIPMASLSRVSRPFSSRESVFPEYHSHLDNADLVSEEALEKSVEAVIAIIQRWDQERTPVPLYRGEPCLTRSPLSVDFTGAPAESRRLYDVMHAIDGRHTVTEIARRLGISFAEAQGIVGRLEAANLVEVR